MNHSIRNVAIMSAMALSLGACATTGYNGGYAGPPPASSGYCADCGVVQRIDMRASNAPNATGAVIGGVVGAVAAREIAKNETDKQANRNIATAAGAAAGAVAGNAIQNRIQNQYVLTVRMDDGRIVNVSQNDIAGIREGSPVRVYNGRAWVR